MSLFLNICPQNLEAHLLIRAATVIKKGGVIVYPTDSGYALACQLGNKKALDKIRRIRKLDKNHFFSLVCRDLSELSTYAILNNRVYKFLKMYLPGPYTFILKAGPETPRRLQHPKRKTIGVRIPDHPVTQAILETLDEPLMSTSLTIPGKDINFLEAYTIQEVLGHQVDLIINSGNCGLEPTSVIDFSNDKPIILREGKGDVTPFLVI